MNYTVSLLWKGIVHREEKVKDNPGCREVAEKWRYRYGKMMRFCEIVITKKKTRWEERVERILAIPGLPKQNHCKHCRKDKGVEWFQVAKYRGRWVVYKNCLACLAKKKKKRREASILN